MQLNRQLRSRRHDRFAIGGAPGIAQAGWAHVSDAVISLNQSAGISVQRLKSCSAVNQHADGRLVRVAKTGGLRLDEVIMH